MADGRPECRVFDVVCPNANVAMSVGVGRDPASGRGWYWAVVVGPGRAAAVVNDPQVVLPPRPGSLEYRAPGLWADHGAIDPDGQWTVGLEAFGVALDDPWEAWGRAYGDRLALGCDLDWDPVGPALGTVPATGAGPALGTVPAVAGVPAVGDWSSVPCAVHGELLVGSERHELAGFGVHTHAQGSAAIGTPGYLWGWWQDPDGTIWGIDAPGGAPRDATTVDWVAPAPVMAAAGIPLAQGLVHVTADVPGSQRAAVSGGGPGWVRFVPPGTGVGP